MVTGGNSATHIMDGGSDLNASLYSTVHTFYAGNIHSTTDIKIHITFNNIHTLLI